MLITGTAIMDKNISLNHGSGGKLTHQLISDVFLKYFRNETLQQLTDAALLSVPEKHIAFTTDSFVVDPIFFPGGNIGKLAVCGTVNDLAVSGARPLYLSASFIIEEGLPMETLDAIALSMAEEAKKAGVRIVTGDTKVVHHGQCDKVFINTAGIGTVKDLHMKIAPGLDVKPGDKIIINGNIADHGIAILCEREDLHFDTGIRSDCACLNGLIEEVLTAEPEAVKFMRDATRGGLATVLCELATDRKTGIELDEPAIPVSEPVRGVCDLLGFDPLYMANEGKVVMVVENEKAGYVLDKMKQHPLGENSSVIGEVVDNHRGMVLLHTEVGGSRIVDMLAGDQLPRIC